MTARELELLQRAEAAERAVIEAVRQRDILRSALDDFIECVDSTGGLYSYDNGQCAPLVDQDWTDLGAAYKRASAAIAATEQVQP